MRVRAAALVCLLAVVGALVGCGTETAPRSAPPVAPAGPTATSAPAGPAPSTPPPVTLRLANGDLDVPVISSCWMVGSAGSCRDGVLPEQLADAGSPESVDFAFPVAGWVFQADFAPRDSLGRSTDGCWRPRAVVLEPGPDGTFHLDPMGPPATYAVNLFGSGPQGDWSGTFLWTTTRPGPEPQPTGTASIVWAPQGTIDGDHGFALSIAGLARTPRTASASVTATAANGRSATFEAGRPDLGCPDAGSVSWSEPNHERSRTVAALGPAPFTYDVVMFLDGVTHRATATWPDDHVADPFNDDPAPVPLTFDPPLE